MGYGPTLEMIAPERGVVRERIYLYVIVCYNNSFYVGITNNLERRFLQHMSAIGSTKTRRFGLKRVVTAYLFSSRHAALRAEALMTRVLRYAHPSTTSDEYVETLINRRYAAQQYRRGASWDAEQYRL